MSDNIEAARLFHEAYERLAPSFGYETRKASAVPWNHVPQQNRELMTAVCAELLPIIRRPVEQERDEALKDRDEWERAAEVLDADATALAARCAELRARLADAERSRDERDKLAAAAIQAAERRIAELEAEDDSFWRRQWKALLASQHRDHERHRVALADAEREALNRAADEIERELICCDVYERDKGTDRAGREHAICFWAGAARAIVLDHAKRAKAVKP